MKDILIIFTAFSFINTALSQTTFQKTYGSTNADYIQSSNECVQQTSDGGYILLGNTLSFGPNAPQWTNIYLIKTNADGDTLWTKVYGGTEDERGRGVQQTSDGGYIIIAMTKSFGAGDWDPYLIKTDNAGNIQWSKTYGGVGYDLVFSGIQTADNGYIICGTTESFGAGNRDVYLVKTDAIGNLMWTKTFGGASADYGRFVEQTTDGGYIIAGQTQSFGAGGTDAYLIKIDSLGNFIWSKTYGGSNSDNAICAKQTIDGGYVMCGSTYSFGAGSGDIYVIKTDSIGDTLWTKVYGGAQNDEAYAIQQTTDGGYILTGQTYSFGAGSRDVYVLKIDASGDTIWTKTYGSAGDEEGASVIQTTDGGYAIAGFSDTYGAGLYDVYFIKTTSNGTSNCNELGTATIVSGTATIVGTGGTSGTGGVENTAATVIENTATLTDSLCLCNLATNIIQVGLPLFCNGDVASIAVNVMGGTAPYSYQWSNGDTTSGLVGIGAGIYYVTVTDNNGCTAIETIVIGEPLPLSVTLVNIPPNAGDCNGSITANVTGGTPNYFYQWDGNAGNQTTQTADSLCAGEYCVTITDANNCTLDTCADVTLGITEQINKQSITIYPNPSDGKFKVEGLKLKVEKVEVFDLFGRKVLESKEQEIDMSSFSKGFYFVHIGEVVKKVILQ